MVPATAADSRRTSCIVERSRLIHKLSLQRPERVAPGRQVWVETRHKQRLAKLEPSDETSPCRIMRRGSYLMKAMMLACSAAVVLTSCNAAKAQGSAILSQLDGNEDNAVIGELQARNPGSLCSIVTRDGAARLMSFGQQAVVDADGRPVVLSYHPSGGNEASFTGAGIRVSGDLARRDVTDFGKVESRDVNVKVQANGRAENIQAKWTCQKALLTVRTSH